MEQRRAGEQGERQHGGELHQRTQSTVTSARGRAKFAGGRLSWESLVTRPGPEPYLLTDLLADLPTAYLTHRLTDSLTHLLNVCCQPWT